MPINKLQRILILSFTHKNPLHAKVWGIFSFTNKMLELGTKEFTVRNIIASLLVKDGLETSYVYAKFFDLYFIEDLLVQHKDLEDYDLRELTKKELSYLVQLDWNNLKTTNLFRQEMEKRSNT